ncbi:MAG: aminotransferase class IV [Bacteroidetes bacterium]|nr:aminotransferase class IV [Bacteroidota bacterium]MDA1337105.1 aminotransferase class IV [Bacteroidota bacterium]
MMDAFEWQPELRKQYIVNGTLCEEGSLPHSLTNRAFLYGDGFFETIRVCYGKPQLLEYHWNRIEESIKAHHFTVSDSFNESAFQSNLHRLCEANNITEGGRIRITFFRAPGGRYSPESHDLQWVGDVEALASNEYKLNEKGIAVDVYPEMKKLKGSLSNFKNISAMLYVQAGIWAQSQNLEDALVTNTTLNIIESTRSNLFLASNGVLYTPGLDGGPVGGIMRAAVINIAIENGLKVYECNISPQEMLRADELFLTNAIRGIQWVAKYRTKRYFNKTAKTIVDLLNAKIQR